MDELPKKKRGLPSKYTPELGDEICRRLSEGETLIAICRDDGFPDESTVRAWALDLTHPFAPKYTRAREIGYQCMAEKLVEVVGQNPVDDSMIKINRQRLQVDTAKWLLSKALPKIYGDKLVLKREEDQPDSEVVDVTPGNLLKLVK